MTKLINLSVSSRCLATKVESVSHILLSPILLFVFDTMFFTLLLFLILNIVTASFLSISTCDCVYNYVLYMKVRLTCYMQLSRSKWMKILVPKWINKEVYHVGKNSTFFPEKYYSFFTSTAYNICWLWIQCFSMILPFRILQTPKMLSLYTEM